MAKKRRSHEKLDYTEDEFKVMDKMTVLTLGCASFPTENSTETSECDCVEAIRKGRD